MMEDAPPAGCTIADPAQRGITLRQLRELSTLGTGDGTHPTVHDLIESTIRPSTRERKCAYAELVAAGPQRAAWYVIFYHGTPVADVIAALEQHALDRGLADDAAYWLSATALAQHTVGSRVKGGADPLPFEQALKAVDGVVSVIDREGEAIHRAWTGFELHAAFKSRGRALAHDIYAVCGDHGKPVGLVDGYAVIDNELAELKAVRELHFPESLALQSTRYALGGAHTTVWAERAHMLARVGSDVFQLDATVRARFGCAVLPRLAKRAEGDESAGPELRVREALSALHISPLRKLVLHEVPGPLWAAALGRSLPRVLEELELLGVHAQVLPGVVECIRSAPLQQVTLLRCGIGDKEAASLADAIADANALETLNLDQNKISDSGARELARGLERCTTLKSLTLRLNQVQDVGAQALAGAVGRNRTLAKLNLRYNKVGKVGVSALRQAWTDSGRTDMTQLKLDRVEG